MSVVKKEERYTIYDIYTLPEGERAELIDGQIYDMAPPSRSHQKLLHFFDRTIGNYIQAKQGTCEIYPAPFAVFLKNDGQNYVEPDISVICDPSKLDEKGCHGAPDWILEIVSPGSRQMDYYKKLFLYHMAGVREYWVVDPAKKLITVYHFEQDTMTEYSFGETVPIGIYPDFSIKVAL